MRLIGYRLELDAGSIRRVDSQDSERPALSAPVDYRAAQWLVRRWA